MDFIIMSKKEFKVYVVKTVKRIVEEQLIQAKDADEARLYMQKYDDHVWNEDKEEPPENPTYNNCTLEREFKIEDVREASYKDLQKQIFEDC